MRFRNTLLITVLFSLVCSISVLGDDAKLKEDIKATRDLTEKIIKWSVAGKIDDIWNVCSDKKTKELINLYGDETKAKDFLRKQYSTIKAHHWTIIGENYEKSNDSLMITVNVFETEKDTPFQKKQLCFVRESGKWKWIN